MSKRTLHFESIGGASGDMILGALIGLGASVDELNEELKSLQVDPFEIGVEEANEQGMSGIRANVTVQEHHHHPRHHGEKVHHHGRHLSTILKLIQASDLPDEVKTGASAVFQRIGEAEAAIHGVDVETIHFHEVGAMDSIIDIVGSCLALHKLNVEKITIRAFPQGHGTIECAHGTYPNPAPATLRLLEGFPVEEVDEPYELVTPTGAALLSSWRTGAAPESGCRAVKSVYSFGHRKLKHRPNLLRATLYEQSDEAAPDEILVLECNLDDMTPELAGCLFDRLLAAGALDVFTLPVSMKKQRPGFLLTALCLPEDRERMLQLIFRESTTFGVRERRSRRTVLDRSFETVDTQYGEVTVKIGRLDGEIMTASPEIEDCRKRAEENGVSVKDVYEAARRECT